MSVSSVGATHHTSTPAPVRHERVAADKQRDNDAADAKAAAAATPPKTDRLVDVKA